MKNILMFGILLTSICGQESSARALSGKTKLGAIFSIESSLQPKSTDYIGYVGNPGCGSDRVVGTIISPESAKGKLFCAYPDHITHGDL